MSGTAALSFDVGGFYFSPFPPFHLAGANALIYQPLIALEASAIIGLPDRPPTPQFILDILKHKKPRALYLPPSLIELISQMPGGLEALGHVRASSMRADPFQRLVATNLRTMLN